MNKYIYFNVCLVMRTPNEEGMKVNFKDKLDDIIYAVKKFNSKFKDYKEIKLFEVTDINEVILFLKIQVPLEKDIKDISARELSYFSKRLAHDKDWQRFSRVRSSLFTTAVFELLDDKGVAMYNKSPIFPDEYNTSNNDLYLDEIDVHELTDEEALEIFKSLLIVQNIGDSNTIRRRQSIIEQIKKLLVEAFK